MLPSYSSVAVAPASVYVDPTSIVTEVSPVKVITGSVVSNTFTVLTTSVAWLPAASETL